MYDNPEALASMRALFTVEQVAQLLGVSEGWGAAATIGI
jgi:hypothetical protein